MNYFLISIMLFSGYEALCGTKSTAVRRPAQQVAKAKQIFISGPTKNELKSMDVSNINFYAHMKVKTALLEEYAKNKALPISARGQNAKHMVTAAGEVLSPYAITAEKFLLEQAKQQAQNMSSAELKKYYDKNTKEFGIANYFRSINDEPKIKPFSPENFDLIRANIAFDVFEQTQKNILSQLATEYDIKSDSPHTLEAVKKAQNKTLFDFSLDFN